MNRSVIFVVSFIAALALARVASAQEVVLTSPEHRGTVRLVPIAGGTPTYPRFLVSWSGLSAEPSSGALVFYREGATERSYVSVGKVAPFVLVDDKEQTLVAGTAVPVYRLVLTHVPEPIELRVDSAQHPKVDELRTLYEQSEGLARAEASKADVQTALDQAAAAFQQACGARPKLDVKWSDFGGDKLSFASALGAVVRGVADQCAAPKYRSAIAKLTTFHAHFDPAVAADSLALRRSGSTVELAVGIDVTNPRPRATAWIASEL